MNQVNPFIGAVAMSPQVQRQQAAEKDRHLRRAQEQSRNAALSTDQFEHQVENAEAIEPVHDEQQRQQQQQQHPPTQKEPEPPADARTDGAAPRLDLTA